MAANKYYGVIFAALVCALASSLEASRAGPFFLVGARHLAQMPTDVAISGGERSESLESVSRSLSAEDGPGGGDDDLYEWDGYDMDGNDHSDPEDVDDVDSADSSDVDGVDSFDVDDGDEEG